MGSPALVREDARVGVLVPRGLMPRAEGVGIAGGGGVRNLSSQLMKSPGRFSIMAKRGVASKAS